MIAYKTKGTCAREIDFEVEKLYQEIGKMLERLSQKKTLMLVLNKKQKS